MSHLEILPAMVGPMVNLPQLQADRSQPAAWQLWPVRCCRVSMLYKLTLAPASCMSHRHLAVSFWRCRMATMAQLQDCC